MPKSLLVVEGSVTIREAARLALVGEDWEVTEARRAKEALAAAQAKSPDAVLCADSLGETDGYDLSRQLRFLPDMGQVPIVLMGARVDAAAALDAGATATLSKPFAADELLGALEAAVERQAFAEEEGRALEPVELEELVDPLSSEFSPHDAELEEVEIIDLSGSEEFEDIELIEDLEPVPAPFPSADAPCVSLDVTEPGVIVFEEADLLSPGRSTLAPVTLPAESSAPFAAGGAEAPADVAEDEILLELETDHGHEVPLEIVGEHGGWATPPPETAAAAAPWDEPILPGTRGLPTFEEASEPRLTAAPFGGEDFADATEKAVRAALAEELSSERLSSVIQAVVERVVWEVVPPMAERLIQEAIDKLRAEPPT